MTAPGGQGRRVRVPIPPALVVGALLQVALPLYLLARLHHPPVLRVLLTVALLVAVTNALSVAAGTWLTPLGLRPAQWMFKRLDWSGVHFVDATGQRPNRGAVSVTVNGRRRAVRLVGTRITDLPVIREYAADHRRSPAPP